MIGAHVSLDWFRRGVATPASHQPVRWLVFCERTILDIPAPARSSRTGEAFTRSDGRWIRLVWRRDDGRTPALLSAALHG